MNAKITKRSKMQDESSSDDQVAQADYEAPEVRALGRLAELTNGQSSGDDGEGFGGNPSG